MQERPKTSGGTSAEDTGRRRRGSEWRNGQSDHHNRRNSSDVGGRGISAILILLLGIDMFPCDFSTRKGSGELARCELLAAFNLFVTDHPRSRSTNHEWEK